MKAIERLDRYLDDLNADRASRPVIPNQEIAALWRMARRLKVATRRTSLVPDANFADALERELLERQASRTAPHSRSPWERVRLWSGMREKTGVRPWQAAPLWQRGAAIALTLLLAIGLTVTALGPQCVLADLQRMLGYVPGIGFVNLEQTRLLSAPIQARRDGVTLRVDQVLAGPDRTVVMLHAEGLPPAEYESAGGRARSEFEARLRLPNGQTLTPRTWRLNWGSGTLELPPLPEGVYQVTLEIARLPLVPDGVAPEDWAVPLALQPATGPLVAALFPEPYAPAQTEDTHHDITLRVVEVAHGPEE
ncbi:MAG: hypothetical protein GXY79_04650, partial [Chloroflexi bacterium]|nr:hypothetical protein [Chloroflexota bacterium]